MTQWDYAGRMTQLGNIRNDRLNVSFVDIRPKFDLIGVKYGKGNYRVELY